MSYKRKCSNWIQSFIDFSLPRSAAPESYHFYAALFTLAAAVRRNIKIPDKELGSWECFPHLYIFFVGPPGTYKTTTMKFSRILLDRLDQLCSAPNQVSPAALLTRLVESKDNSVYVYAKEFSDLVSKQAGEQMYEFLTSMYDGDAKFEAMTISRGIEYAHEPCLNLFAATTPGFITNHMPETAIDGGLASRCIVVYEYEPRFRKLFFDKVVDIDDMKRIEELLVEDLIHISEMSGEFTFTDEAKEYAEKWNSKLEPNKMGRLAGYYNRKPKHVLSLAMLLTIARTDELVIDLGTFKQALAALDQIEPRMKDAFAGIGKNPYTADTRGIYKYIQERGEVNRKSVAKEFESSATPVILHNLIDGLVMSGSIKQLVKGNDIFLSVI